MSGGGGNSGAVSYPPYMQNVHGSWLGDALANPSYYMTTLIEAGSAMSPYDNANAYIPDAPLASNQSRFDTFNTLVASLNHSAEWDAAISQANAKRGAVFISPNNDVETIELLSRSNANNEFGDAAADAITRTGNLFTAGDVAIQLLIDGLVDDAVAKATSIDLSDVMDNLVDAYEDDIKPAHLRSISRMTGGMADINAVNSSAFVIGLTLAENQFQSDVRKFRAERRAATMDRVIAEYGETYRTMMQLYANTGTAKTAQQLQTYAQDLQNYMSSYLQYQKDRDLFLIEGANQITQLLSIEIDSDKVATTIQTELNRMKIIAKKEQTDRNIDLDVLDAKWPFDLLLMGGNMLASMSGSAYVVNRPMSAVQSALSGVMTGASVGATIGTSIEPGVGTAIGAGIGVVAGAFL